jgi:hypothetical protein
MPAQVWASQLPRPSLDGLLARCRAASAALVVCQGVEAGLRLLAVAVRWRIGGGNTGRRYPAAFDTCRLFAPALRKASVSPPEDCLCNSHLGEQA